MAELDDFFAKKDKKKSKNKTKFVTADELVKNLEDNTKREVVKPKKPEPVAAAAVVDGGVAVVGENETDTKVPESVAPVEEEWNEIEPEQRKDYSGLKIGQLSANSARESEEARATRVAAANDAGNYEEDDDDDSNGYENVQGGKGGGGGGGKKPWKKLIPAEEVTQIPVPVEVEKSSSKPYVSPALRYSQISGLGSGIGGGSRARRTAPDITNTEFFPTLSAARPEEQRKKKNEPAFEEVRHGGRFQRVQEPTSAPVAATNRFQSLDDEADS
ncbi:GL11200 [Drosophila persimilis]|uniref:Protein CDV3 homolog n=2 Tax=pseudoobscura subgroup TaxID=32358 RepID=A0A6I8USK2_DROPS|nr:protein CDV3 homolog [Drosophila pseudoobscura]XP_002015675.1 protein CDV3 homolog [Drosophila persimilis]EDW31565.1 GL11200 [Drosophila persimilis]